MKIKKMGKDKDEGDERRKGQKNGEWRMENGEWRKKKKGKGAKLEKHLRHINILLKDSDTVIV